MKVVKSSADIILISSNENMIKISDSDSGSSELDLDSKNSMNNFEDVNANTEPNNSDTEEMKDNVSLAANAKQSGCEISSTKSISTRLPVPPDFAIQDSREQSS